MIADPDKQQIPPLRYASVGMTDYAGNFRDRTLAEDGSNFCDDLVDGNRREAFLSFDDAGLEAAAPAVGLVVEDAMLFAVGEPDPRLIASGKDGYTGGLHCCGEMHGAAVVANEQLGLCKDCGTLARRQEAAEVDDWSTGVLPPALCGKLAGFALLRGSAQS
jgi:hypothetical protein